VEWAERAEGLLPQTRVEIHLAHAGGDVRAITIECLGMTLPEDTAKRLQQSITESSRD
jgi:tRNA A37 threonylcarbamoyladenosine biosynthesis protein TsaE